ncbi:MAG TPA: hypothetical protein VMV07_00310 [Streptosporangiaceae bacterium]|nr:hypothetical protein [Streptosporangiaceae bacterium]
MRRESQAGALADIFFDPTGRRRRLFRVLLLVITCAVATATALIVIGLTAPVRPPRTVFGQGGQAPPPAAPAGIAGGARAPGSDPR